MKKKIFGKFGLITLALTALYVMVPACGSSNGNNNGTGYYGYNGYNGYGTTCIPGQVCATGTQGVSLLQYPAVASIDSFGSMAQLTFGGQSVVAGSMYQGPVYISGMLQLAASGMCPPGQYQVQGQGTWQAGVGGAVARVTGTLQTTNGMQAQINVLIYAGQDPSIQVQTGYYMQGNFATSCDPTGVAM